MTNLYNLCCSKQSDGNLNPVILHLLPRLLRSYQNILDQYFWFIKDQQRFSSIPEQTTGLRNREMALLLEQMRELNISPDSLVKAQNAEFERIREEEEKRKQQDLSPSDGSHIALTISEKKKGRKCKKQKSKQSVGSLDKQPASEEAKSEVSLGLQKSGSGENLGQDKSDAKSEGVQGE